MRKIFLIFVLLFATIMAAPSPYNSHNSYLGETVDTQTGALVLSNTDVSLPGRNGMGISVARSYNSKHYKTKNELDCLEGDPHGWTKTDDKWQVTTPGQWSGYVGHGWQFNVGGQLMHYQYRFAPDTKILKNADEIDIDNFTIQLGNGKAFNFKQAGSGIVPADPRMKASLEKIANGYVLHDQSGTRYYFTKRYYQKQMSYTCRGEDFVDYRKYGSAAKFKADETIYQINGNSEAFYLDRVENAYGDWVDYEYKTLSTENRGMRGGNNKYYYAPCILQKVKNSLGNSVDIEYNAKKQIKNLGYINHSGRKLTVSYEYDDQDQLISATNPRGEKTSYKYKDSQSGLIDSVTSPLGGTSRYEYYWQDLKDENLNNYTVKNKTLEDGQNTFTWKYEHKGGHTYDVGNGKQFCFAETTITDPRNIKTTHYYRNGYPVKEYLPNQVVTEYEWDYKTGNKLKEITVKSAKRFITEYKNYDEYGNPWTIINYGDPDDPSDDKEMHNEYLHRLKQNDDGDYPTITKFEIEANFLTAQIVHSWVQAPGSSDRHNEVYFRYDTKGNLVQKEVIVADDRNNRDIYISRYRYNDHGELIQKIEPNGASSEYFYNYGFSEYTVRELREGGQLWTQKTYSSRDGVLKREEDSKGFGAVYSYDDYGFLTGKQDLKTNLRETYSYRLLTLGAEYTKTDALGNIEVTVLDRLGRKERTDVKLKGSAFVRTTQYQYAPMPQLVSKVIDYLGRISEVKYDSMDRPVININFDGTYTVIRYYDTFNYKEVYDVKKNKITYYYDAYGNLTKTVQPNEAITEYKYNIYGKLERLITNTSQDPKQNVRSTIEYTYDSINRLLQIKKGTQITRLEYDNMDNVVRKYLPHASAEPVLMVENRFDQYGRLTQTDYRDPKRPEAEVYNYYSDQDNYGRLKNIKTSNGETDYTYDQYGNVASVTRKMFGQTRTTYYKYNEYGELLWVQYPGLTDKVVYNYDDRHRLANVEYDKGFLNGKQKLASWQYTMDIYERPDKLVYANGTETKYTYDDHDRVNSIEGKTKGIDRLYYQEYKYDELGNRSELTWAMENYGLHRVEYEYDTQYQLTRVQYDDGKPFNYKYDDNGNRTFFSHEFGYDQYFYEQFDRLAQKKENQAYTSFGYDFRGNLISKERSARGKLIERTEYDFDIRNQLRGVSIGGVKKAEYEYDGGLRIAVLDPFGSAQGTNGDKAKYFWYGNGSEVLVDTDATGNVTARYIMAGKQKIVMIDKNNNFNYYHTDVLGSIVAVTDSTGKLVEANIYGPFGEAQFSYKGTLNNRYGYTGQEQDTPGGLQYYGARWYDSDLGRFISEDPASASPEDPLSINRYIYCRNNPLIYTDPTGMFFAEIFSMFGPIGTLIGGMLDAAVVNMAVQFAVTEISADMARNGNIDGAKALMGAYQAFTIYQTVTMVIDLFGSISKMVGGEGSQVHPDVNQKAEQVQKKTGESIDTAKSGDLTKIDVDGLVTEPGVYTRKHGLAGLSFSKDSNIANIDKFLEKTGSPIGRITSGYRTAWDQWGLMTSGYDAANPFWKLDFSKGSVNYYKGGFHQRMMAFDVVYYSTKKLTNRTIINAARISSFGGVGVGQGWVHIDHGPVRSWSY